MNVGHIERMIAVLQRMTGPNPQYPVFEGHHVYFFMDHFCEPRDYVDSKRRGLIPIECGSVACLGGLAVLLNGEDVKGSVGDRAAEILSIDQSVGTKLFTPKETVYYDATPEQAIIVLRHLINTGKADWSVAFGNQEPYKPIDEEGYGHDELETILRPEPPPHTKYEGIDEDPNEGEDNG